jgi:hypothetical protein
MNIMKAQFVLYLVALVSGNMFASAQQSKQFEYTLTPGYQAIDFPGSGTEGFFLQNSFTWHPEKKVSFRLSVGMGRANNYPGNKTDFAYADETFIVARDSGRINNLVYDMIKDKPESSLLAFELNHTSNFTVSFHVQFSPVNARRIEWILGGGICLVNTNSNRITLSEAGYNSNGRLQYFKILSRNSRETFWNTSLSTQVLYSFLKDYRIGILFDRVLQLQSKVQFNNGEWFNIGLSLNKRFNW